MEDLLNVLEKVTQQSDGSYMACCPAHDDNNPSLWVKEDSSKQLGYKLFCHAGCTKEEIFEALELEESSSEITDTLQWLDKYIGIRKNANQWRNYGLHIHEDEIEFSWYEESVASKFRSTQGKKFNWSMGPKPPLWPQIPESLPEEIYITEGEGDCLVLLSLGYCAFSLTGGTQTPIELSLLDVLYDRGVKKVYLCLDQDTAGIKAQKKLTELFAQTDILCVIPNMAKILCPEYGEKDLRDAWIRINDKEEFITMFQDACYSINKELGLMNFDTLLTSDHNDQPWLIENVIRENGIGFLVGPPKAYKSILSWELGLSIASGQPFMNEFKTNKTGSVIVIDKETSLKDIQFRSNSILRHKKLKKPALTYAGNGRYIVNRDTEYKGLPIYTDASRNFILNQECVNKLIQQCKHLEQAGKSVKLIILDPLLRMLPAGVDMNDAPQVNTAVIQYLSQIRKATGAAVLVIHHSGKIQREDNRHMSWYGSIMLFLSADFYMTVGNEQKGYHPVVSGTKGSGELSWQYAVNFNPFSINYKLIDGEYESVHSLRNCMTDIYKLFQNSVIVDIATLYKHAEGTHEQINKVLSNMLSDGVVKQVSEDFTLFELVVDTVKNQ